MHFSDCVDPCKLLLFNFKLKFKAVGNSVILNFTFSYDFIRFVDNFSQIIAMCFSADDSAILQQTRTSGCVNLCDLSHIFWAGQKLALQFRSHVRKHFMFRGKKVKVFGNSTEDTKENLWNAWINFFLILGQICLDKSLIIFQFHCSLTPGSTENHLLRTSSSIQRSFSCDKSSDSRNDAKYHKN